MIKITLEQLEGFFNMEAEGKWNEQTAMDFAELTEGDIVAVSTDLEKIEELCNDFMNEFAVPVEIICVDGVYMGIDSDIAREL